MQTKSSTARNADWSWIDLSKLMSELELRVKEFVENIFHEKTALTCASIGKDLVKGFEQYLASIGIDFTGSMSNHGLFAANLLPFKGWWIEYGAHLMSDAIKKTYHVDPFVLPPFFIEAEKSNVYALYKRVSTIVHDAAAKKNSPLLEGILIKPIYVPNENPAEPAVSWVECFKHH